MMHNLYLVQIRERERGKEGERERERECERVGSKYAKIWPTTKSKKTFSASSSGDVEVSDISELLLELQKMWQQQQ